MDTTTLNLTSATVAILDDLIAGRIDTTVAHDRLVTDAKFSPAGATDVLADAAWSRALYAMTRDHRSARLAADRRTVWAGHALPGFTVTDPWAALAL